MSPAQYRALDRLVAADWVGVTIGDTNDDGTIHHATAIALARRGLVVVVGDGERAYAKVTTDGVKLAAAPRHPEAS